MPSQQIHDFSRDGADDWHDRIQRWARTLGLVRDVLRTIIMVMAGLLFGALAGGLIGGKFENVWANAFWAGLAVGALLGGLAGFKIGRRMFLNDHLRASSAPSEADPAGLAQAQGPAEAAVFAPHVPGVQDTFSRARGREIAMFLVMLPSAVCAAILAKTGPGGPIVPGLSRDQLLAVSGGLTLAMLALIVVNGRCPACRQRIGSLMTLRRCPKCGVALRN
jgi:hypothetical protein